jgi:hypothetical protein
MVKKPSLNEGDTIEHSLTVETVIGGQKIWIKTGATTTVRTGESPSGASKRLANFVSRRTSQQVQEIRNAGKSE